MARLSERLINFSGDIYEKYGFGNDSLLYLFLLAVMLSLFALLGSDVPALATLMNGLMTAIFGGSVFIGISLLTALNPLGMIFGAICGLIVASLSMTLCSLALIFAPAVAALILLPNLVACIICGLALPFLIFEGCCGGSESGVDGPAARRDARGYENYLYEGLPTVPQYTGPGRSAYFDNHHPPRGTGIVEGVPVWPELSS
jgi:hypothetical protein